MSNAPKPTRPLPQPDSYVPTVPFWEAARQGRLVLQYCCDSQQFQHYPRPVSRYTGRRNLEWRPVSGNGVVYAHTLMRVPMRGFEDRVPYIVVIVELQERVRLLANLVNCRPEDVRIGMPVRLSWERLSEDINYPNFEPARDPR